MVDVSGIPNMGFGGGGYFGGSAALGQPAMSAAQINAGMWGNYSPGAAQATQANIYGAGGFGAQPAYYAGLGAAYGRATGGFGGYGAANADPFTAVPLGTRLAPSLYGGSGLSSPSVYNAPRSYGWDANEGADPFNPYVVGGGAYNAPRSYGWDANEGAPAPAQPDFNDMWVNRGAQGLAYSNLFNGYSGQYNPQPAAPQQSLMEQLYGRMGLPQPWTSPMSPNAGAGWGGFDSGMGMKMAPSLYGGSGLSSPSSAGFWGAYAQGTPQGTREPVPDARTYMPSGQFGGYLDHYLWGANSGNLGTSSLFGGNRDTAALGGWPYGGYVPQPATGGGGGIGSDAYFGGQGGMYGSQAMTDAMSRMRGGQGWTIASTPPAVSQENLANRINQGIYDIGNAGDYYSRSIGGGFGMGMPNQGQGLTAQDLANPHAYSPGVRFNWGSL